MGLPIKRSDSMDLTVGQNVPGSTGGFGDGYCQRESLSRLQYLAPLEMDCRGYLPYSVV